MKKFKNQNVKYVNLTYDRRLLRRAKLPSVKKTIVPGSGISCQRIAWLAPEISVA
jgi:hypothetical protein